MDKNKIKDLISEIWICYNKHNREGYVTDEMSEFADRVEKLTNYLEVFLI